MPSINRIQLIGNVTADTPLSMTKSGKKVANFTVATNEQWKNDSGEVIRDANFHKVVAWNGLAEYASRICNKGRLVFVEGKSIQRDYEDSEGNKRRSTEVLMTGLRPLDFKKLDDQKAEEIPTENIEVEVIEEEELVAA